MTKRKRSYQRFPIEITQSDQNKINFSEPTEETDSPEFIVPIEVYNQFEALRDDVATLPPEVLDQYGTFLPKSDVYLDLEDQQANENSNIEEVDSESEESSTSSYSSDSTSDEESIYDCVPENSEASDTDTDTESLYELAQESPSDSDDQSCESSSSDEYTFSNEEPVEEPVSSEKLNEIKWITNGMYTNSKEAKSMQTRQPDDVDDNYDVEIKVQNPLPPSVDLELTPFNIRSSLDEQNTKAVTQKMMEEISNEMKEIEDLLAKPKAVKEEKSKVNWMETPESTNAFLTKMFENVNATLKVEEQRKIEKENELNSWWKEVKTRKDFLAQFKNLKEKYGDLNSEENIDSFLLAFKKSMASLEIKDMISLATDGKSDKKLKPFLQTRKDYPEARLDKIACLVLEDEIYIRKRLDKGGATTTYTGALLNAINKYVMEVYHVCDVDEKVGAATEKQRELLRGQLYELRSNLDNSEKAISKHKLALTEAGSKLANYTNRALLFSYAANPLPKTTENQPVPEAPSLRN